MPLVSPAGTAKSQSARAKQDSREDAAKTPPVLLNTSDFVVALSRCSQLRYLSHISSARVPGTFHK